MDFLDFHHHQLAKTGIYNLNPGEKIPDGKFSAGLHPKDITEDWKSDFEKIQKISLSENCLAIGECGLDGLIQIDETLQNEVFKAHISAAVALGIEAKGVVENSVVLTKDDIDKARNNTYFDWERSSW